MNIEKLNSDSFKRIRKFGKIDNSTEKIRLALALGVRPVGKCDFNENLVFSLDLDFGLRLRVCQFDRPSTKCANVILV